MNTSSYTDEQLLNLVNNSILKHTEFKIDEFSGGSISVTSVHKNTRQNYKVNMYFGYRGKNPINRSLDIKKEFYYIWCKAIHLKVVSISEDNIGADFNELNELMQNPKPNNTVVSSKLDSNIVVSTENKGSSKDTIKGSSKDTLNGSIHDKKSINVQIEEKINECLKNDVNICLNAFREWLDYKKYKNIAQITKTVNFLSKYDFETQQQIVDNSIMNGYKGLFEPKNTQQRKSFKQQDSQRTDDALDAFLDAREKGFDLRNIHTDDVQDVEVIER